MYFDFFKQETAYEVRISDWSSDVCSSDLADQELEAPGIDAGAQHLPRGGQAREAQHHEDPADAQGAQDEDLRTQVRTEKDDDEKEIEEVQGPRNPTEPAAPAERTRVT